MKDGAAKIQISDIFLDESIFPEKILITNALVFSFKKERENWRLLGKGRGIHWESLDEDISVEGLLTGQPSGESQSSFKKWLESRN